MGFKFVGRFTLKYSSNDINLYFQCARIGEINILTLYITYIVETNFMSE